MKMKSEYITIICLLVSLLVFSMLFFISHGVMLIFDAVLLLVTIVLLGWTVGKMKRDRNVNFFEYCGECH